MFSHLVLLFYFVQNLHGVLLLHLLQTRSPTLWLFFQDPFGLADERLRCQELGAGRVSSNPTFFSDQDAKRPSW